MQETEGIQAVIDRHHHHVFVTREIGAVVRDEAAGAGHIGAAVQPDHDRAFARADAVGPDVQTQAVFPLRLRALERREGDEHDVLATLRRALAERAASRTPVQGGGLTGGRKRPRQRSRPRSGCRGRR